jgi:hypothetical protein
LMYFSSSSLFWNIRVLLGRPRDRVEMVSVAPA